MNFNAMIYKPLVSIIVVTYNSSKYVIETLESARLQSYKNVELIVTDDSSSDDTVEICKNWGLLHASHFVKFTIIESRQNQGIASNCNKGLLSASGEWIKLIAGDDILLSNCVEDYIAFASATPNARIIVGGLICFDGDFSRPWFPPPSFQGKNASEQCRYQIQYGSTIAGAAPFISKLVFDEIGVFDEKYQFMEDFPFFVKATAKNIRIFTLKKLIAKYRSHQESISQNNNSKFLLSYSNYMREVIFPLSKKRGMYLYYWHKKIRYYIQDRKEVFPLKYKLMRYFIVGTLDPYGYYIKVNKLIQRLMQ